MTRTVARPPNLLATFLVLGIVGGLTMAVVAAGPAGAAQAPVGLGTAGSYAVLGGSTVTNTGASVISGNLGVSPGAAVTGFPPGLVIGGAIHRADAAAAGAQADVIAAYDDAASRTPATALPVELGGTTRLAGVYSGGTLGLTGTLTLDAKGDPNAVFVFRTASTLMTASNSSVALINGASPCNVFWKVGSSATLGTGSKFIGTVLALTAISAQTGAVVQGRLIARNAAVTLDDNVITRPACGTPSAALSTAPASGIATGSTTGTGTTGTGTTGTGTTPGAGAGSTTGTGAGTATTAQHAFAPQTTAPTGNTTASNRTTTPAVTSTTPGRSTTTLARTGTALTLMTAAGLIALILGGLALLTSRRAGAGPKRRR